MKAQVSHDTVIKRLVYTCKVWGYLKHHHSSICQGKVNLDSILVRSLDGIKNAKSHREFNDSLFVLVSKAGTFSRHTGLVGYRGDSIQINTDTKWMNDSYYSNEIQNALRDIKTKFRAQGCYSSYYTTNYSLDEKFPDENSRILDLFRYWNIINYYYPFKNFILPNWESELLRFLPIFINVTNHEDLHLNYKKLTKSINDSKGIFSSSIYDSLIGIMYPPFDFRFVEGKTIVNKVLPTYNSVKMGDEVLEIQGIPVNNLREKYREIAEGANRNAVEFNINDLLLRKASSLKLLGGDGKEYTIEVNLREENKELLKMDFDTVSKAWKDTTLPDGCRYAIIDMPRWKNGQIVAFVFADLWEVDAIIFDLRGEFKIPFAKFEKVIYSFDYTNYYYYRKPCYFVPGEFYSRTISFDYYNRTAFPKNLILLVDERTRGNAEEFGISFQTRNDLIVIGDTTDGSGSLVKGTSMVALPGDIRTEFTSWGVYDKNGIPFHGRGIPLDYQVKPTIAGIRAGRDEVMEFALDCKFKLRNSILNSVSSLEVYPNPVKDKLNIQHPNINLEEVEYLLADYSGRTLISDHSKLQRYSADLSNLSAGIYVLSVKSNNKVKTYKIVKE